MSRLPGPASTAVRRPGMKAFRGRAARVARRQPTRIDQPARPDKPRRDGAVPQARRRGQVRCRPAHAGSCGDRVTCRDRIPRVPPAGPPCCGRASTAARHRSASMFPVCAFTRSTRNEGSQRLGSVSHCRAEVFLQTAQEPLVARPAAGGVLADRRLRPWHASAVGAATRPLRRRFGSILAASIPRHLLLPVLPRRQAAGGRRHHHRDHRPCRTAARPHGSVQRHGPAPAQLRAARAQRPSGEATISPYIDQCTDMDTVSGPLFPHGMAMGPASPAAVRLSGCRPLGCGHCQTGTGSLRISSASRDAATGKSPTSPASRSAP